MNKDGGLSYFDLTTGDTVEKLDNTTFVSLELSTDLILFPLRSPTVYKTGLSLFAHSSQDKHE